MKSIPKFLAVGLAFAGVLSLGLVGARAGKKARNFKERKDLVVGELREVGRVGEAPAGRVGVRLGQLALADELAERGLDALPAAVETGIKPA